MCSPHDSSLWVSDWNKLYSQIENPSLKELMTWPNKGKLMEPLTTGIKATQPFGLNS